MDYIWGAISNGLITRRSCEAALFKASLSYGSDGLFNRDDCGALGGVPGGESLIDIDVGERP